MKKYILASDYDGTLVQKGEISSETIQAINEFRERGNVFAIVTGRDYVNGFKCFKGEGVVPFDFVIASNGATACDREGDICFVEKVSAKGPRGETTVAREIISEIQRLTSNVCGIAVYKARYDFHPEYPMGVKTGDMQYSPYAVLDDIDEFVSMNALCNSVQRSEEVTAILKEKFGDYVNPTQNGRCIDITPAGVDKATGILRLAEVLGVDQENIWTAGDNFNDIAMVRRFHGCAMTNGMDDLKKVAQYVCDNVAEVIKIILSKQP